ncbi:MAG: hypothetical protein NTY98_22875 [Verrucomicrobia bacterium]|nr:hypothetical protein [Verrucomicrobiota bacterium]
MGATAHPKTWQEFCIRELMKAVALNLSGQILFGMALFFCIPPVMSNTGSPPPSGMPLWVILALFALSKTFIKFAGNEKGWSIAFQVGIFAIFVVALKERLSLGL